MATPSPETARKVQDSVSAAVSGMTGYNVHAVNVHVGGSASTKER